MGRYNLDGKVPMRLTPEQEFMRAIEGKVYTEAEWVNIRAEYDRRYGNKSGGSPTMERVVRPFLTIDSQTRQPVSTRPPLPGEDTPAFIEWGRSAAFVRPPETPLTADPGTDLYTQLGGGGFRVRWPQKPNENDDDDGNEKNDIVLSEIDRRTKTVRIEDPDDSSVYVEVARITSIRFRSSRDGQIYRFEVRDWND